VSAPDVAMPAGVRDGDLRVLAPELDGLHQIGDIQIPELARELRARQLLDLETLERERAAQLTIQSLTHGAPKDAHPVFDLRDGEAVFRAGSLERQISGDDLLDQRG